MLDGGYIGFEEIEMHRFIGAVGTVIVAVMLLAGCVADAVTEAATDEKLTPAPTVGVINTDTPAPTVDPASVDGLPAGTELTPAQCAAHLTSAAFDGRAYELLDGRCLLVRWGADHPVPEEVRADIERRGYAASDPIRAPYELKDASRAGIEVAYLTCSGTMGGGWGANGVNTHGSYDEMVNLLNDWVANGTSRAWVTVSTC